MRLSYVVLDGLLSRLTERLVKGEVHLAQYFDEYDQLVAFAGWTWDDVVGEIDSRWTLQAPATPPRSAFLC